MTYLRLFLGFLRVGLFSFGGAYSAIPLIRDVALAYGWLEEDALAAMIAVSESTPGPIMVNLATYVGMTQAGVPGALLATLTVVLPSFVIILLVMVAFRALLKHGLFQAMLGAVKPCVVGMILAAGAQLLISHCLPSGAAGGPDVRSACVALGLLAALFIPQRLWGRKPSPIALIVLSAAAGILVWA